MPFLKLKEDIAQRIAGLVQHPEVTAQALLQDFSVPPSIELGHVALPCFRLSKALGKPPGKIAAELLPKYQDPQMTVTQSGPYLNFRLSPNLLYAEVLNQIFAQNAKYGADTLGKGQRVLLEFCSPNIAKRLGFQHIRSTLIGSTLSNIYEALGFETLRMNFVGDWGTQFARLLAAFELWGNPATLNAGGQTAMDHLLEVYVRFHREIETNPELGNTAQAALRRLESNDSQAIALWKQIRDVSVTAMEKTLRRMNVSFQHIEGESEYINGIEKILDMVKEKASARPSEGAWIVDIEGISTPALIQKRDGTTLYLTRDVAAALDRKSRLKFDRMFYVVSEQQKLHFQMLFGILKKMGHAWSDNCGHISFGTVLFGAEKMSTREGRVIFLDDILNDAKSLALAACTEKNPNLIDKEAVAEIVGIGAVVFGQLSAHRGRDIEFDWKKVLALDGETGPYVQYACVRCQSLLEKANEKGDAVSDTPLRPSFPLSAEEETLVLLLGKFRSTLHACLVDNEPYHLTHYLIDVAKAFNRFYYRFPVLQASDPEQKMVRLQLVKATLRVLQNGLKLLGIEAPKEM